MVLIMFIIGFEIECISSIAAPQLKRLLKKAIKTPINLVSDCTIKSTQARPHQHEFITPPLPQEEANALLVELFDFCKNNDCVANPTTGLHVNVSFQEKMLNKWINPLYILEEVEYDRILKKWGREKRLYSRSFEYYYKKIRQRVKTKYKVNDWTDPYAVKGMTKDQVCKESIERFIVCVFSGDSDLVDKYNRVTYNRDYDDKHTCINLNYLKIRGYIEFRMIGGAKYLNNLSSVQEDIEHILNGMKNIIKRSPK